MDEAISDFRTVTKIDPQNSFAWLSLYEALLNSERVDEVVVGEKHNSTLRFVMPQPPRKNLDIVSLLLSFTGSPPPLAITKISFQMYWLKFRMSKFMPLLKLSCMCYSSISIIE